MYTLDQIKDWNDYQYKDIIIHIFQNHTIEKIQIENKIFRCTNCDNLEDETYINLEYDINKTFISIFNCNRCKTEMKPLLWVNLIKNNRCPDCGEISLSLENTGIWD